MFPRRRGVEASGHLVVLELNGIADGRHINEYKNVFERQHLDLSDLAYVNEPSTFASDLRVVSLINLVLKDENQLSWTYG